MKELALRGGGTTVQKLTDLSTFKPRNAKRNAIAFEPRHPGRVDSLNDETLPMSDSAHETSYSYYQEGDNLTYTKIEKVHIAV
jgi:hypothetical protein